MAGHDPGEALWRAMKMAKADQPNLPSMLNGKIDYTEIMKTYDLAKSLGVYDRPENLELTRREKPPLGSPYLG